MYFWAASGGRGSEECGRRPREEAKRRRTMKATGLVSGLVWEVYNGSSGRGLVG
jgi:hypothetical protein